MHNRPLQTKVKPKGQPLIKNDLQNELFYI